MRNNYHLFGKKKKKRIKTFTANRRISLFQHQSHDFSHMGLIVPVFTNTQCRSQRLLSVYWWMWSFLSFCRKKKKKTKVSGGLKKDSHCFSNLLAELYFFQKYINGFTFPCTCVVKMSFLKKSLLIVNSPNFSEAEVQHCEKAADQSSSRETWRSAASYSSGESMDDIWAPWKMTIFSHMFLNLHPICLKDVSSLAKKNNLWGIFSFIICL